MASVKKSVRVTRTEKPAKNGGVEIVSAVEGSRIVTSPQANTSRQQRQTADGNKSLNETAGNRSIYLQEDNVKEQNSSNIRQQHPLRMILRKDSQSSEAEKEQARKQLRILGEQNIERNLPFLKDELNGLKDHDRDRVYDLTTLSIRLMDAIDRCITTGEPQPDDIKEVDFIVSNMHTINKSFPNLEDITQRIREHFGLKHVQLDKCDSAKLVRFFARKQRRAMKPKSPSKSPSKASAAASESMGDGLEKIREGDSKDPNALAQQINEHKQLARIVEEYTTKYRTSTKPPKAVADSKRDLDLLEDQIIEAQMPLLAPNYKKMNVSSRKIIYKYIIQYLYLVDAVNKSIKQANNAAKVKELAEEIDRILKVLPSLVAKNALLKTHAKDIAKFFEYDDFDLATISPAEIVAKVRSSKPIEKPKAKSKPVAKKSSKPKLQADKSLTDISPVVLDELGDMGLDEKNELLCNKHRELKIIENTYRSATKQPPVAQKAKEEMLKIETQLVEANMPTLAPVYAKLSISPRKLVYGYIMQMIYLKNTANQCVANENDPNKLKELYGEIDGLLKAMDASIKKNAVVKQYSKDILKYFEFDGVDYEQVTAAEVVAKITKKPMKVASKKPKPKAKPVATAKKPSKTTSSADLATSKMSLFDEDMEDMDMKSLNELLCSRHKELVLQDLANKKYQTSSKPPPQVEQTKKQLQKVELQIIEANMPDQAAAYAKFPITNRKLVYNYIVRFVYLIDAIYRIQDCSGNAEKEKEIKAEINTYISDVQTIAAKNKVVQDQSKTIIKFFGFDKFNYKEISVPELITKYLETSKTDMTKKANLKDGPARSMADLAIPDVPFKSHVPMSTEELLEKNEALCFTHFELSKQVQVIQRAYKTEKKYSPKAVETIQELQRTEKEMISTNMPDLVPFIQKMDGKSSKVIIKLFTSFMQLLDCINQCINVESTDPNVLVRIEQYIENIPTMIERYPKLSSITEQIEEHFGFGQIPIETMDAATLIRMHKDKLDAEDVYYRKPLEFDPNFVLTPAQIDELNSNLYQNYPPVKKAIDNYKKSNYRPKGIGRVLFIMERMKFDTTKFNVPNLMPEILELSDRTRQMIYDLVVNILMCLEDTKRLLQQDEDEPLDESIPLKEIADYFREIQKTKAMLGDLPVKIIDQLAYVKFDETPELFIKLTKMLHDDELFVVRCETPLNLNRSFANENDLLAANHRNCTDHSMLQQRLNALEKAKAKQLRRSKEIDEVRTEMFNMEKEMVECNIPRPILQQIDRKPNMLQHVFPVVTQLLQVKYLVENYIGNFEGENALSEIRRSLQSIDFVIAKTAVDNPLNTLLLQIVDTLGFGEFADRLASLDPKQLVEAVRTQYAEKGYKFPVKLEETPSDIELREREKAEALAAERKKAEDAAKKQKRLDQLEAAQERENQRLQAEQDQHEREQAQIAAKKQARVDQVQAAHGRRKQALDAELAEVKSEDAKKQAKAKQLKAAQGRERQSLVAQLGEEKRKEATVAESKANRERERQRDEEALRAAQKEVEAAKRALQEAEDAKESAIQAAMEAEAAARQELADKRRADDEAQRQINEAKALERERKFAQEIEDEKQTNVQYDDLRGSAEERLHEAQSLQKEEEEFRAAGLAEIMRQDYEQDQAEIARANAMDRQNMQDFYEHEQEQEMEARREFERKHYDDIQEQMKIEHDESLYRHLDEADAEAAEIDALQRRYHYFNPGFEVEPDVMDQVLYGLDAMQMQAQADAKLIRDVGRFVRDAQQKVETEQVVPPEQEEEEMEEEVQIQEVPIMIPPPSKPAIEDTIKILIDELAIVTQDAAEAKANEIESIRRRAEITEEARRAVEAQVREREARYQSELAMVKVEAEKKVARAKEAFARQQAEAAKKEAKLQQLLRARKAAEQADLDEAERERAEEAARTLADEKEEARDRAEAAKRKAAAEQEAARRRKEEAARKAAAEKEAAKRRKDEAARKAAEQAGRKAAAEHWERKKPMLSADGAKFEEDDAAIDTMMHDELNKQKDEEKTVAQKYLNELRQRNIAELEQEIKEEISLEALEEPLFAEDEELQLDEEVDEDLIQQFSQRPPRPPYVPPNLPKTRPQDYIPNTLSRPEEVFGRKLVYKLDLPDPSDLMSPADLDRRNRELVEEHLTESEKLKLPDLSADKKKEALSQLKTIGDNLLQLNIPKTLREIGDLGSQADIKEYALLLIIMKVAFDLLRPDLDATTKNSLLERVTRLIGKLKEAEGRLQADETARPLIARVETELGLQGILQETIAGEELVDKYRIILFNTAERRAKEARAVRTLKRMVQDSIRGAAEQPTYNQRLLNDISELLANVIKSRSPAA